MNLLVSLFVISKNLLLVVFLPRKIITILQKIAKFQTSVIERFTSPSKSSGTFEQNPSKVIVKRF